jgi:hypothetical protein
MALLWQAKPGCPVHLRDTVERFVNDRDSAWRLSPARKEEIFDLFNQCQERLNVFAMIKSFAVTIRDSGDPRNPYKRFRCIHHGDKTRNNRDLKYRVKKDSEGKIFNN